MLLLRSSTPSPLAIGLLFLAGLAFHQSDYERGSRATFFELAGLVCLATGVGWLLRSWLRRRSSRPVTADQREI